MKEKNELIDQVSFLMKRLMKISHSHGRKILIQEGLTFPQYYVLSLLNDNKQYRMNDLKQDLSITGASTTKVADHLVKKSLAKRGRWSSDRRIVNITVTDKGKELIELIEQERKKFYSGLLNKLRKDEKEMLNRAVKILSSAFIQTQQ